MDVHRKQSEGSSSACLTNLHAELLDLVVKYWLLHTPRWFRVQDSHCTASGSGLLLTNSYFYHKCIQLWYSGCELYIEKDLSMNPSLPPMLIADVQNITVSDPLGLTGLIPDSLIQFQSLCTVRLPDMETSLALNVRILDDEAIVKEDRHPRKRRMSRRCLKFATLMLEANPGVTVSWNKGCTSTSAAVGFSR